MARGGHGRGHAWWKACVAGGPMWQGVYVWQEKWQLQQAGRILLECILVLMLKVLLILINVQV